METNEMMSTIKEMAAIYGADFKSVSDSGGTEISIDLRPSSKYMSIGDNIWGTLSVRFLPEYPRKTPCLELILKEGLENNVDRLLSLLCSQVNIKQDGGDMIFHLVETAQEFLSEISIKSVHCSGSYIRDFSLPDPANYGLIDIFQDLCDEVCVRGTQFGDESSNKASRDKKRRKYENVDKGLNSRMNSGGLFQFDSDLGGDLDSRYLRDFEEVSRIGAGGFGSVMLCRNKLDGRQYAMKKIRIKHRDQHGDERTLREVAALSRMQHRHVVRYYQAWIEAELGSDLGYSASESGSDYENSVSELGIPNNGQKPTYLFIQMEYCPRTLHDVLDSVDASFEKVDKWKLFRQIVEGLEHIHSHGIIHRDLTAKNIFFDDHNDVKIGDFGLAKFLKLEEQDNDPYFPTGTSAKMMDGLANLCYYAPELRLPQINEKADIYSLGIIFLELWCKFGTVNEKSKVMDNIKKNQQLPCPWADNFPVLAKFVKRLISLIPSDRPTATEILRDELLPPRMKDNWLNEIVRTIRTSEDSYVQDRVVSAIFDKRPVVKAQHQHGSSVIPDYSYFKQYTEVDTILRDNVVDFAKEVFRRYGAQRLEVSTMRMLDSYHPFNRESVKLLTYGGKMLELCHELRSPFINWMTTNEILLFKRYEVSSVYRTGPPDSSPYHFLQGDYDIVGDPSPLADAEVIKVGMEIATEFFRLDALEIHMNHWQILEAVWSWIGVEDDIRPACAKILSAVSSSSFASASRLSKWCFMRQHLLKDLKLREATVDRLEIALFRFCGPSDLVLARLRGTLSAGANEHALIALEELSILVRSLKWQRIYLDALMPPVNDYYRGAFFQIYMKSSEAKPTMLVVGGRYDTLVQQLWDKKYKSNPPGAVGVSVALEKIMLHTSMDILPSRQKRVIGDLD